MLQVIFFDDHHHCYLSDYLVQILALAGVHQDLLRLARGQSQVLSATAEVERSR